MPHIVSYTIEYTLIQLPSSSVPHKFELELVQHQDKRHENHKRGCVAYSTEYRFRLQKKNQSQSVVSLSLWHTIYNIQHTQHGVLIELDGYARASSRETHKYNFDQFYQDNVVDVVGGGIVVVVGIGGQQFSATCCVTFLSIYITRGMSSALAGIWRHSYTDTHSRPSVPAIMSTTHEIGFHAAICVAKMCMYMKERRRHTDEEKKTHQTIYACALI